MTMRQSVQRLSLWLKRGRLAPRPDRFRRRLSLEYLEDRTVPSTLFVRGDQSGPGFPDVIDLAVADSGGVRVTLNGDVTEFAPGQWTDVRVESGGGNDMIRVLQTATGVPVSINSTGNARVVVGASGSVQGIRAGVTITNSIARTTVEVDDSADTVSQTVNLSSVLVAGGNGRRVAFSGAAPIDARDSATRSLTVHTGAAGAQVNVQTNTDSPVALVVHADNTDVSLLGGAIAVNGPQTIRNLSVAGGELRGAGDLTVAGAFTWTGGTLRGPGRTIAQGTMLLSGGIKTLTGGTLVNAGTATWVGGDINASRRGALTNQPGALFDIQADASFISINLDTNPLFTNLGTVRKSAGPGTTRLAIAMNNAGGVEVNAGILSVSNGTSSGSFAVAAGATLQFLSGTYVLTASSAVSGDGRVLFGGPSAVTLAGSYNVGDTVIDGGTASFDGDASTGTLTLVVGTFTGVGMFSVNGLLTWNSGFMSGTGTTFALGGLAISGPGDKILNDRTLDNFGDAAWTGGIVTIGRPAVINNFAGAVFDIRTDLPFFDSTAEGAFNNAGTLRKSAGVGVSQFAITVNNTGAVEVLTGTLELWDGGNSTGSFTVQAGATLTFVRGDYLLAGSSNIAGGGDVRFTGGTAYIFGGYAIAGNTTVSNIGTAFFFTASPVEMGTLTISDSGTAVFFSDATAGALTQSGGQLTGTGTLTVTGLTTWTGGGQGGGGRTVAGGGLRLSSPSAKFLNDRTIDNQADAVWLDGDLSSRFGGGVINNLAGATFDIQADGVAFTSGGISIFNNFGTLRKSAGAGTVALDAGVNNTGTVEVRAGTLGVADGSSTGAFTVQSGATLLFAFHHLAATVTFGGPGQVVISRLVTYAGDFRLSEGTLALTVAGTLTVTDTFTQTGGSTRFADGTLSAAGGVSLQGGTLSGSGTIVGNVTNAASINVGDATTIATLSITGNYTQTAAGNLTLKLGGTAFGRFDRLVVSNAAALAGTLTVRLVNGYMPASGDTLRVLTAPSLTGMFGTLDGDGPLFNPQYDATGLTLRRP